MWKNSFSREIAAPASVIWGLFCHVDGWKEWNAGIEAMEIFGPFAAGTRFRMKPPGQEALDSQLLEVCENEVFVDETHVGDLTVLVSHRLEVLGDRRTRVTYQVEAYGPGCDDVGPAVSADFPAVLAELAALAVRKSG